MKSPAMILEILHSFVEVELDDDGCVLVWEKGASHASYITSFVPGSFTYELLALIEHHLKEPSEDDL
jgi:hypothetical protein